MRTDWILAVFVCVKLNSVMYITDVTFSNTERRKGD
jgi:hypothetical protein